MRGKVLVWTAAALLALVLAYAWIDGGLRPMRDVAEPVPVPEHRG